ncbi:hypothetical protein M0812_26867 [Anaeramoeba flamelloides]|uniref:Uncharacterized protein n=1 Tax=Anaeramoeba flamelloides TaxID=1746091 RepID=A0AAV7YBW1_9EUKA|nr:hypothetical protein M0812_26867 [Anaeramoeba flamelloides]
MNDNYEPILDPDYSDLFQDEFQYPLFDFDTTPNSNENGNQNYDIKQLQSDFEIKGEISQKNNQFSVNEKNQEQEQENENENENQNQNTNGIENYQNLFLKNNHQISNPFLLNKQSSFTNRPLLEKLPSLERFLTFDRAPSLERLPSLGRMPSFTRQTSFPRQLSFTRQPSFPRQPSFQRKPSFDRMSSFGNSNKGSGNWLFSQKNSNGNNSNLRGNNSPISKNLNNHNVLTRGISLESVYKIQEKNPKNPNQSLIIKKKNHKNPIYIPKLQKKTSSQSILFNNKNNNNNDKCNNNNNINNINNINNNNINNNDDGDCDGNNKHNNNNNSSSSSSSNNNFFLSRQQKSQTSSPTSFLGFLNHPNIELIMGGELENDSIKFNNDENENENRNKSNVIKMEKETEERNGIRVDEKTPTLSIESKSNNFKPKIPQSKIDLCSTNKSNNKGKLQKSKTQFTLQNKFNENNSKSFLNNNDKDQNQTLNSINNNTKTNNGSKKKKYKKKKTKIRIKIGTRHKDKDKNNNQGLNKENSKTTKLDDDSRKRLLKLRSLNQSNSVIIESGKEVFKLLTGQLWVISGGAPQKLLTKYTNTFAQKIGILFQASETEEESFHSQLKYLLSNSRRTFTEFILEILIGILSLKYSENPPEITLKFWKILEDSSQLNSRNENDDVYDDDDDEEEEYGNDDKLRKAKMERNDRDKEELNIKLEEIYQFIYTEKVLMHWFEKRFVERLGAFFNGNDKRKFYEQHLFYLGKSKFILSCLLSNQELIKKENGLPEKYYKLVNLEFQNNPLNVYLNNRGKKLNLVKDLIIKYGLNNGSFWNIISKDYLSKMKFTEKTIFDYFPFKNLITNPLLAKLCKKVSKEKPQKKRNASSSNFGKSQVQINVDWLFKKRAK